MFRTAALLVFVATFAVAQKVEWEGVAGAGTFGASGTGAPAFATLGSEVCGLCSGRVALFAEYTHWERAGNRDQTGINRVDLIAGGVRLQGGRSVRPFVDAGIAGGWDRYLTQAGQRSHANPGMALGGGAAIPLRGGWYIRPQARMTVLRGTHAGGWLGVGIGYRFPER